MRGWKPGPVTAVGVVVAAALVIVMMGARVECFHFHSGYSHHYTYKAVNSMLGHRNVTTVIKVSSANFPGTEARLYWFVWRTTGIAQCLLAGIGLP